MPLVLWRRFAPLPGPRAGLGVRIGAMALTLAIPLTWPSPPVCANLNSGDICLRPAPGTGGHGQPTLARPGTT
ncbi:MAG: hypothetical protein R3E96_15190 [Planctomycetota bacterium]